MKGKGMDPLTIVVTGAAGFLGRACVAEARRQGLPVLAIFRSAPAAGWEVDSGITPLRLDLARPESTVSLRQALPERGAIIHAAGHLGGDPGALGRDTIQATRNLLSARREGALPLVLISSLAVYDAEQLSPGATLTESSPLIALQGDPLVDPEGAIQSARDPYAGAKRLQETMLSEEDGAGNVWILRPGLIWGPGRSWNPMMGFGKGPFHVTLGSDGELPLAHVDHVAWAAVAAARAPAEGIAILNVIDDVRPDRAGFLQAHRAHHGWPRLNVTVSYDTLAAFVRMLRPVSHRLPGLLRGPVLRARMMPLRYSNTRLRSMLGGADTDTFEGLMARSGRTSA